MAARPPAGFGALPCLNPVASPENGALNDWRLGELPRSFTNHGVTRLDVPDGEVNFGVPWFQKNGSLPRSKQPVQQYRKAAALRRESLRQAHSIVQSTQ